jgi:DNA-directed RNA polymerase specialized sigma24 family protein
MTDFDSLYQSYAPQVRRFVLFLSGDAALADHNTSETFVSCRSAPCFFGWRFFTV